jgi:transcriptional regulator with XRE-family HTH domain
MYIAQRLRDIRESMELSQGDIENRTGLMRCYISRIENGHTMPSVETLEKISRALEVRMYQLFYEGEETNERSLSSHHDWASQGKGKRLFMKFLHALPHISAEDRTLLLFTAAKMADAKRSKKK